MNARTSFKWDLPRTLKILSGLAIAASLLAGACLFLPFYHLEPYQAIRTSNSGVDSNAFGNVSGGLKGILLTEEVTRYSLIQFVWLGGLLLINLRVFWRPFTRTPAIISLIVTGLSIFIHTNFIFKVGVQGKNIAISEANQQLYEGSWATGAYGYLYCATAAWLITMALCLINVVKPHQPPDHALVLKQKITDRGVIILPWLVIGSGIIAIIGLFLPFYSFVTDRVALENEGGLYYMNDNSKPSLTLVECNGFGMVNQKTIETGCPEKTATLGFFQLAIVAFLLVVNIVLLLHPFNRLTAAIVFLVTVMALFLPGWVKFNLINFEPFTIQASETGQSYFSKTNIGGPVYYIAMMVALGLTAIVCLLYALRTTPQTNTQLIVEN